MKQFVLKAGTVVHINGVPLQLTSDTVAEGGTDPWVVGFTARGSAVVDVSQATETE